VARDTAPTTGVIYFGNSGSSSIYYNGTAWQFSPALPSDIRLKRNVRDLTGGVSVINQLRVIEAEWNDLAASPGKRVVSLIAQELQRVLPDTIVPYKARLKGSEEETELLSFESLEVLCHMILAIQQLSARFERAGI
jgi:hypothetical protein